MVVLLRIDTGDRTELLAHNMDVEAIREYLDVDTLAYLDLDRLPPPAPPGQGSATRPVRHHLRPCRSR